MGRFLTRDTYTGEEEEPESLHLYAYRENDGANAWDPSGHRSAKYKLYDLGKKHVGWKWFKCIYSTQREYTLTVKILKKEIKESSKKNNIKKAIIQSIVFRELLFWGIEDQVADTAVALGFKKDSSTGPAQIYAKTAQIYAKTAINAHNAFNSKKIEEHSVGILYCRTRYFIIKETMQTKFAFVICAGAP